MKLSIIVSIVALAMVACSGSPSSKETHPTPPVMDDASTPTVDATAQADVSVQAEASNMSHDTGSGSGSSSGSGSGSGSSSGSGSGSSHSEDAGHDAAPPPPTTCTLPNGTYAYTFTAVTGIQCDNTLLTYSVGPAPLGSIDLGSLLPGFCHELGDMAVETTVGASNSCSASATYTCSDPVPTTPVDGGAEPLKLVTASTISSNANATELTGTISLTETDEVNGTSCTETYTFTAKQTL